MLAEQSLEMRLRGGVLFRWDLSDDFRESAMALAEKRDPVFRGS
jgi:hypothetical protein